MSKVYVVTSGTKFPKCVQGIFATKAEAVQAMALGAHKLLRGPFEMDFGSTEAIAAPVKRKQKSRYYFAVARDNPADVQSFVLPNTPPRWMNALEETGGRDMTNYVVGVSLESREDAELRARAAWEALDASRRREAASKEQIECWREVNRWEEIARTEERIERLKREAATTSLEDALATYNRRYPS